MIVAVTMRGQFTATRPFYYVVVSRLHADGRPDVHFAGAGKTTVWDQGGLRATMLLVRPGGQIVVGGLRVFPDYPGYVGVVLQLRGGPGT